MFRVGIRIFDQALKSDIAAQGSEQVERAAAKISNPLVRRFVMQHLVKTGGAVAVSVARGAHAVAHAHGLMDGRGRRASRSLRHSITGQMASADLERRMRSIRFIRTKRSA